MPDVLSFFAYYTIAGLKIPARFPMPCGEALNNSVKDGAALNGIFADFYLTIVFRADTIRLDVGRLLLGGAVTGAKAGSCVLRLVAFCDRMAFAKIISISHGPLRTLPRQFYGRRCVVELWNGIRFY